MNKSKNLWNSIWRSLLCVFISALIGTLLLMLVFLLPKEPIRNNVKESAFVFIEEGSYYAVSQRYPMVTILDNFTDALMLTQAATPNEDPFYIAAMKGTYLIVPNGQPTGALIGYAFGLNSNNEAVDYPRYWHGHQVILKPLLMLFDYSQIRFVNFIMVLFVSSLALFLLYKKAGVKYALAYLATVVCISPSVMPFSLQNVTIYYITALSVIAMCTMQEKIGRKYDIGIVFCIIGLLTSYFDFLTYPTVTLGVPLVLAVILFKENKLAEDFYMLVKSSICWAIGYIGMWMSKWLIGSAILQKNVLADALESVRMRMGQNNAFEAVAASTMTNNITISERIGTPLQMVMCDYVILLMLVFVVVSLILAKKGKEQVLHRKNNLILFGLIALIPFVWYILVANHTVIHYFFTFRTMATFFFAFFSFCVSCFDGKKNSDVE